MKNIATPAMRDPSVDEGKDIPATSYRNLHNIHNVKRQEVEINISPDVTQSRDQVDDHFDSEEGKDTFAADIIDPIEADHDPDRHGEVDQDHGDGADFRPAVDDG